ncbi:MAG: hypothetical protein C4336_03570, partial [Armatimonadota bacterium]
MLLHATGTLVPEPSSMLALGLASIGVMNPMAKARG